MLAKPSSVSLLKVSRLDFGNPRTEWKKQVERSDWTDLSESIDAQSSIVDRLVILKTPTYLTPRCLSTYIVVP